MVGKQRETAAGKADYTVGYGRPPLATRFKPGNAAARGRRPPGAADLARLLATALDARTVVVGEDGSRRRIAKRELGIVRLADKFAEGDPTVIKLMLGLLLELERRPPREPAAQGSLVAADKAVIENFFARWRKS